MKPHIGILVILTIVFGIFPTTSAFGAATVTSITPASGAKGSNVPVTITGTGFVAGATSVSFSGTGAPTSLTFNSVSVSSETSLTAVLAIGANTAPGAYCCVSATVSGTPGTSSVSFTVTEAASSSGPTVTSISPSSGVQGSTVSLTVGGTGFVAGGTTVTLTGTGATAGSTISVSNVKVTSTTSLTAQASIPASAAIGTYSLVVTTSAGSGSGTFSVTAPPPPTVTSVSPSSGPQGGTLPLTFSGTGFLAGGTTVSMGGSGATISFSNVKVASSTSFTATASIPSSMATGAYGLTITTAGGTAGTSFTVTAPTPHVTYYQVPDQGVVSLTSAGSSSTSVFGYANVVPNTGSIAPSGLAIYGLRQNDIFVTEVGVTAAVALTSGRTYAEISGPASIGLPVYTGLAIANPNSQTANISFYFTDEKGVDSGSGTTTVPANTQIIAFLDKTPYNGKPGFTGSFTFSSSVPISVVAVRSTNNERNDFLAAALPIVNLNATPATGNLVFPDWANGAGWATLIVLTNPTDTVLIGSIQFRDPSGQLTSLTIGGQSNNTFSYSIPARSSVKFQTSGGDTFAGGSVTAIPATGSATPSGLAIFTYQEAGFTTTLTGFPPIPPGTAFRLYAEASGDFDHKAVGSMHTGIAVTNTATTSGTVALELFKSDGSSTGLTATVQIPALGQKVFFLNDKSLTGWEVLPKPFRGVLRVTSPVPISVVGVRGRYNERKPFSDSLMTITPSVNEATPALTDRVYFPLIADGAGYTTQFILFNSQPGQSPVGSMQLFTKDGVALPLTLSNN